MHWARIHNRIAMLEEKVPFWGTFLAKSKNIKNKIINVLGFSVNQFLLMPMSLTTGAKRI